MNNGNDDFILGTAKKQTELAIAINSASMKLNN